MWCCLAFAIFWLAKLFDVVFWLQNYQHNPWLIHLTAKLLVNDPGAISLIGHNPFQNGIPPRLYYINEIDGFYTILVTCMCVHAQVIQSRSVNFKNFKRIHTDVWTAICGVIIMLVTFFYSKLDSECANMRDFYWSGQIFQFL